MEEIEGILLAGHKEDAVEVPFDPSLHWGIAAAKVRAGRNGHFVRAVVNGISFETAIVPRMKKFFLLVDEDTKAAAGISTGDKINVTVEPFAAPANG